MTLDQIDRMVRQANPVPDPSVLEPGETSVLAKQRRMEMQTHNRVEVEKEPERPRQGLFIGIAAAAAVVIGALLLLPRGNEAPVADQPAATPVEIATAFLEAYAAYDVDEAASYLTTEALAEFGGSLESLRLDIEHSQAQGFKVLLGSCEGQASQPSGTLVRCTYDYQGIRSDEIGLGPYSGSWYDLTVLDGEIVSVSNNIVFMPNGFSSQMWEPFARWIAETYPDDGAIMYENWPSIGLQQFTEESNALWEQRSREYVEVVKAGPEAVETVTAFLDAYGNYDADLAASYLVGDAMNEFGGDLASMRFDLRFDQATGFQLILDSCEARTSSPAGTIVHCTYEYHDLGSDEIGLGPFSGDWYDFTVQDEKIVSVEAHYDFMRNGFSNQMWEPFASWIAQTHPEDGPIMYAEWPDIFSPATTDESMALWEQRTREYVTVVGG